jgi:hypothetical protein
MLLLLLLLLLLRVLAAQQGWVVSGLVRSISVRLVDLRPWLLFPRASYSMKGTNSLWNAKTGVKKSAIMHWCKTDIGVAASKHATRKR